MIRFKWTLDKDEEQAWLNEYCQQGWAMVSFFAGMYTFIPCNPGEFIYQVDLLPGAGLQASNYESYVEFMYDAGVEVLQRWGRWVFLRTRTEDGPFEIYTDLDSKIALYRRIRKMFLWVLMVQVLCSASVWTGLLFYGGMIYRGLAAVYILLFIFVIRTIWRCTRRIGDLERQRH